MSDKWEEVTIGSDASFQVTITPDMVDAFANISGDDNPLHTDEAFAKGKGFIGRVAHGMLLGSLLSRLVGKYFIADNNLYLSQTLSFRRPVVVGDNVVVKGTVVSKSESARTLEIKTVIVNVNGEDVITGIAVVKYI